MTTNVLPRSTVELDGGSVAYADVGDRDAPAALFVHGVFLNADLWRNVIAAVRDTRRCVAIDLPGHGRTQLRPTPSNSSLTALAELLASLCDALGLEQVDLVANDTGGAVAQVFAARHPSRLRTLTLTNCDVDTNLPPERFKPAVELARRGELAPLLQGLATDKALARSDAGLGVGYEDANAIPDDVLESYLGRYAADGAAELQQVIASLDAAELVAAKAGLERLDVPTLVAWGTADVFFELSWAHWLRDVIPGASEVVEIEGGKLFYPDERAADLVPHLRRLWESAAKGASLAYGRG